MSQHHNNKFSNPILSLFRSIRIAFKRMTRQTMRSLLRVWMRINRQDRYGRAGFVLPTVVMVLLVVVLLTITIMLRSMDRAKMAQYRRVDEQVLQAATPALDRARSKIKYLLSKGLPTTATPSDDILYETLRGDTYNFGDETRLKVQYDINKNKNIDPKGTTAAIEDNEELETAWRFPIDTDNNGKLDTYTLYGIYFRRPGTDENTQKLNPRNPLDARTLPMSPVESAVAGCEAALGNVAGFLDDSGWSRLQGNLMKSFFVYTTSVPITDLKDLDPANYETKIGTTGYSALEYQEDQIRVPLTNNAVVYEDDLDITPGPAFNLNGRIIVNSNLIVTPRRNNDDLQLYLVSSPESCYYNAENSKIIVGGNVVNGRIGSTTPLTVPVHLFRGLGTAPETGIKIATDNQSVTNKPEQTMYNTKAYAARINNLVEKWSNANAPDATGYNTADPESVQEQVKKAQAGGQAKAREEALKEYFKDRTIRVPFLQVAAGTTETKMSDYEIASDGTPRPKESDWRLPTNKAGSNSVAGLIFTTTPNLLEASDPDTKADDNEAYIGDRVLVGNNMAAVSYEDDLTGGKLPYGVEKWTDSGKARYRISQIQKLPTAGSTRRDGDWETWAAEAPEAPIDAIGGLRVITGAGVYERLDSFLPPPPVQYPASDPKKYNDPSTTATETYEVVWPDTMPMSPSPQENPYDNDTKAWVTTGLPLLAGSLNSVDLSNATYNPKSTLDPNSRKYAKGDLRMRASVVYHYASKEYHPKDTTLPEPIACVSSYHDPTDSITAKNMAAFPTGTNLLWNTDPKGKSNNGIVYSVPKSTLSDKKTELEAQANMVFPDGRLVNQQLKEALINTGTLTLAQKAAVDSTLCALDILSGDIKPVATSPMIPHGAIKEASFLDSREVKAIHADNTTTTVDETFSLSSPLVAQAAQLDEAKFNLTLENRYPLEIRVTQLDLNQLRNTEIDQTIKTGPKNTDDKEYLLPYSGIIYAGRDDALPDRSDRSAGTGQIDTDKSEAFSPTDYKLDPSRRPNGIMLINGQYLARGDIKLPQDGHTDNAPTTPEDVVKQKGLVLVSNLPVYIQDDFNLHSQEEFKGVGKLTQPSWSNFYTRLDANVNESFACQKGDPRLPDKCPDGDTWRPATVLGDSVNVLSENFRFGFRNEGDFDLRNNAGGVKGYDFDGDGILATDTQDETSFKLDLNGNGNITDTAVKETDVTAKAASLLKGFNYYNNFVTNGLSSGAFNRDGSLFSTGSTTQATDTDYSSLSANASVNSSYFNNYVTPIQRRGTFSEYVMEICLKLPVSACTPNDWKVIDGTDTKIPALDIVKTSTVAVNTLKSGTTVTPPDPKYQRFPRRVAFLRTSSNTLQLDGSAPIPIGVNGSAEVKAYAPATCPSGITQCTVFSTTVSADRPRTKANALWFQTLKVAAKNWGSNFPLWYYDLANTATSKTFSATIEQPLLVPVLQIHATNNTASTDTTSVPNASKLVTVDTRWLTPAGNPTPSGGSTDKTTTTVNVIVGAGDVPSRTGLFNGGLQNLIRFQENWETPEGGTQNTTQVLGSFIQIGRSSYATAPYESVLSADTTTVNSLFGNTISNKITIINSETGKSEEKTYLYKLENNSGRTPFFVPPSRSWGYDVGLLSQPPDKFAQTYTVPSSDQKPNKYFREVSRDDEWVKGLLCAKIDSSTSPNAINRPSGLDCSKYGT